MEEKVTAKQGENEVETAARLGMTASPVRFATENGTPFVIVPEGFEVESLEKLCPKPMRKRGTIETTDTDSFCRYVTEHMRTESTAYASIDVESYKFSVIAILDDHEGGEFGNAGWRKHRCVLAARTSFEFDKWRKHDRQKFTQAEFAEFLEDNVQDITGGDGMPTGTDVLQMALNFERTANKRFRSKTNLQSGCVQLEFVDEENEKSRERMQMFERFTIAIPVFQTNAMHGEAVAYPVQARLKYREKDGELSFWYELIRADRVFQAAVADEIKKLPEQLLVIYGTP